MSVSIVTLHKVSSGNSEASFTGFDSPPKHYSESCQKVKITDTLTEPMLSINRWKAWWYKSLAWTFAS